MSISLSRGCIPIWFGHEISERDLLFSALPFVFGACANVGSGVTSDFLLKRFGLRPARSWVGIVGLGSAGLCALLAAFTPSKIATLLLLSLCFGGIGFSGPMQFTICLDVARKSPGSTCGAMNTATQVGSFLSGVAFGYVAKISGSYDLPLILMAFVLGLGALMWLRINPVEELISEDQPELARV